jgi:hypothetical protein
MIDLIDELFPFRSFTEELEQCIVSGAVKEVPLLASAMFLLAVIVNGMHIITFLLYFNICYLILARPFGTMKRH